MRNKEHIAANNRLCLINDLGAPRNTIVGNYCPFLGRVWNGNYTMITFEFLVCDISVKIGLANYRIIFSP